MSYNKQIYFWTLNGFGPNGDISLLNMRVFRGKMHKIQNGLQPFPNYKTKVRGRVVQCWGTPWGSLQILSFIFFSKVILCKNSHFFYHNSTDSTVFPNLLGGAVELLFAHN